MKITTSFLKKKNACEEGIDWVAEHNLIGLEAKPFLEALIKADRLDWANWLIVRVLPRKGCLAYAIYAAEQVLHIYEKKHPNDLRPRKAIEAAKKVLEKDTKENRLAAWAASYAVYAAATATSYAAWVAAWATSYAAWVAWAVGKKAEKAMHLKILKYGIKLLK